MDPIDAVQAVRRVVESTTTDDGLDARRVVAERSYPSPIDDVWNALTDPDPALIGFMRACGESWGEAEIAGGAEPDGARARSAATIAFYTGG